ncbi:hypothetical protein KEM48_011631 [Puccinia striiformis f. sp. tritici PST-130]|nr:hypothetical protein KEM48_011631 [Puccinia striiformis f. sp. tritici PST-130]
MGKAQYKRRIRSARHHANGAPITPQDLPNPSTPVDQEVVTKSKNKKPKNQSQQNERQATIAVLDKISSPASHDRIWSLAAMSNLVLSSATTRQLFLSKNLIRLLINRLVEDADQEDVLVEVTGVLRNLVIEGGRDARTERCPNTPLQSLNWSRLVLITENVVIILWSLAETSSKWLDSVTALQDIIPLLSTTLRIFVDHLKHPRRAIGFPNETSIEPLITLFSSDDEKIEHFSPEETENLELLRVSQPTAPLSDLNLSKASIQGPSPAELKIESIERRLTLVQLALELVGECEVDEMEDSNDGSENPDDEESSPSGDEDVDMEKSLPSRQVQNQRIRSDHPSNEYKSNAMDIEESEPFVQSPQSTPFSHLLKHLDNLSKPTPYLYQTRESEPLGKSIIPTAMDTDGVTSDPLAGTESLRAVWKIVLVHHIRTCSSCSSIPEKANKKHLAVAAVPSRRTLDISLDLLLESNASPSWRWSCSHDTDMSRQSAQRYWRRPNQLISKASITGSDIPNGLLVGALDGVFDVYADETRDYDEPVFRQRGFLETIKAAVPTIQAIVKKIDKRKDPALRQQAEAVQSNLSAFIDYRKSLM